MHSNQEIYQRLFPYHQELDTAIVHSSLMRWGDTDRVCRALLDLFPKADIHTLFYDRVDCGSFLSGHHVLTSTLDRPVFRKQYIRMLPFYPRAARSLHLEKHYDLLLSSEAGLLSGIDTRGREIPQMCYLDSLLPFSRERIDAFLQTFPSLLRPAVSSLLGRGPLGRLPEFGRVSTLVAGSSSVRRALEEQHHRDIPVIVPPIDDTLFSRRLYTEKRKGRFFLYIGDLGPSSGTDVLVDAFNRIGERLVIVGSGSDYHRLRVRAKENISFYGAAEKSVIRQVVLDAKALVVPAPMHSCSTPLEVLAHGLPVIAYAGGCVLDVLQEREHDPGRSTGCFFYAQHAGALERAVERFGEIQQDLDPGFLAQRASRFSEHEFKQQMLSCVRAILSADKVCV